FLVLVQGYERAPRVSQLPILYYTTLYQIMTLQLLWLIEISSAGYSTYVSFRRSALSSTL
ncbi:hypothetical protein, partial [Blautia sp. DFI.9.10]|uniref:hypothetical protein n=1 Tax=Blautia sp. DFI.9.10 TaxID=2965276 RepID=UPI00210C3579